MKVTNFFIFSLSLTFLFSCSHSALQTNSDKDTVRILHLNDHHSKLNASQLKLGNKGESVDVGGYPRVVTMMNDLSKDHPNVIRIHAGDATTGDLFYTLFDGKADAELMNEVCFDAMTFGNHEFDKGDVGLKKFIDYLNLGKCPPALVSANVRPQVGKSPLSPKADWEFFKPYAVKEVSGHKIGIIGLTIAKKTKESSSPDKSTMFLDETQTAQKYIDELRAQGVMRIILVTHIGLENDLPMISKLHGVGVIVGGDSHTLLGNDFKSLGLNPVDDYPIRTKNADGKLACVVQSWEYSLVVGELNVKWNEAGDVESCEGKPHLLTKDVAPNKQAEEKLSVFQAEVEKMKTAIIAKAEDDFCLVRIPGEKRSQICSPTQTAKHGSDIATIVAYSFLNQSKTADFALQNGGGVRTDLAKGDVSIGDVYKVLPFANKLVNVKMSGAEVKQALEEALDYALEPGGSTGAYPYAAGLRFNVDLKAQKGKRITKIQIKERKSKKWKALNLTKNYVVITSDYIASGKDGYALFAKIQKEGRIEETYLDYAQAFVDYLKAQKVLKKIPYSDYSTQSIKL